MIIFLKLIIRNFYENVCFQYQNKINIYFSRSVSLKTTTSFTLYTAAARAIYEKNLKSQIKSKHTKRNDNKSVSSECIHLYLTRKNETVVSYKMKLACYSQK